jgi:hypothetical protein
MAVTWLVNLEVLRVHKSHITRQCGVLQYLFLIIEIMLLLVIGYCGAPAL